MQTVFRKLVPYAGIAAAVALGIALAPFVWWILGGAIIAGAVYGCWSIRERLALPASIACIALLFAWPIWLWHNGDLPNAITALVIVCLLVFWQWIKRPFVAAWGWLMAQGVDPD